MFRVKEKKMSNSAQKLVQFEKNRTYNQVTMRYDLMEVGVN